jgi:hypothetical protein
LLEDIRRLLDRPIRGVIVSLKDTGATAPGNPSPLRGATIALPYERFVPEIGQGTAVELDFELLRDVSSVLVDLSFAGGQNQEIDVHLEQAGGDRIVEIGSLQASQEVDLGATAVFDLRLGRSGVDPQILELTVLGLPPQVAAEFREAGGNARVSQLSFPAGVTERSLELRLTLPEREGRGVEIDRLLPFLVVAGEPGDPLLASAGGSAAEETIFASSLGVVRLAVRPRGIGQLEITVPPHLSTLEAGARLRTTIEVHNPGSRRLDHIQLTAEGPLGWPVALAPITIESLEPHEKVAAELSAQAPQEAPPGEYEIRLRAESLSSQPRIESPERIYRLRYEPSSGLAITLSLLALLIGLTAGLVVLGIRLARR